MSDAARLAFTAIQTRLQAIATSAGYNTNAGSQVYLGVRGLDALTQTFPALSIFSGPEQADKLTANRYRCNRIVQIAGYVSDTAAPTTALEYLIEDIQRALELSDETLGGLVNSLSYEGIDVIEPREDGGTVSTLVVRYSIEYDREVGT